jgi:hypothetical protein
VTVVGEGDDARELQLELRGAHGRCLRLEFPQPDDGFGALPGGVSCRGREVA